MTEKRQVKLSLTEEMYEAIKSRADSMSISPQAFISYVIGEKLNQYKSAEKLSQEALAKIADSMALSDKLIDIADK